MEEQGKQLGSLVMEAKSFHNKPSLEDIKSRSSPTVDQFVSIDAEYQEKEFRDVRTDYHMFHIFTIKQLALTRLEAGFMNNCRIATEPD